jgi:hypothetical protein
MARQLISAHPELRHIINYIKNPIAQGPAEYILGHKKLCVKRAIEHGWSDAKPGDTITIIDYLDHIPMTKELTRYCGHDKIWYFKSENNLLLPACIFYKHGEPKHMAKVEGIQIANLDAEVMRIMSEEDLFAVPMEFDNAIIGVVAVWPYTEENCKKCVNHITYKCKAKCDAIVVDYRCHGYPITIKDFPHQQYGGKRDSLTNPSMINAVKKLNEAIRINHGGVIPPKTSYKINLKPETCVNDLIVLLKAMFGPDFEAHGNAEFGHNNVYMLIRAHKGGRIGIKKGKDGIYVFDAFEIFINKNEAFSSEVEYPTGTHISIGYSTDSRNAKVKHRVMVNPPWMYPNAIDLTDTE